MCKACSLLLEHCYFQASQWTELGNRCMFMHTHIWMYVYKYMSIHAILYTYPSIYLLAYLVHFSTYSSNTALPGLLFLLLSIFVASSFDSEKLDSYCDQHIN